MCWSGSRRFACIGGRFPRRGTKPWSKSNNQVMCASNAGCFYIVSRGCWNRMCCDEGSEQLPGDIALE